MFGGWLPEEVAVRVFRWLAPEDLARAELVCRQWHGLLSLSPASSSLTPWLWRKVHERHFGGPMPTKKKKKSFDQRTFCLHSARLLHKYQQSVANVGAMLTWAINCGHHAALAHILATSPAAVRALPERGALAGAVGTGDERVVELVCAHGVPVPPHMVAVAVRQGSLAIVGVLLRYAVPEQQTNPDDGAQPPPPAIVTPLDHIEALLQGSGTSTHTLWHLAAEGGHVALMAHLAKIHQEHSQERYRQLLLSYSSRGYTALQVACCQNNRRVFDFLVSGHVCDELLNAPTRCWPIMSALLLAVKHAGADTARRLLELGAQESNAGLDFSPLHVACTAEKDREELMALLVERGADLNARTKHGGQRTCLHILAASRSAPVEALQFLLDKGADARLLSGDGKSALEPLLAKRPDELARKLAMGELLLAHGCPIASRASLLVIVLQWLRCSWRRHEKAALDAVEQTTHDALQWLFDRAGWPTPLDAATDVNTVLPLVGSSSPRIMVLLAANGLNVASHVALEGLFRHGPQFVLERNLKALIGLGLDLNMRHPQTGAPPMHYLDAQFAPLLARHGADVNAVDAQGLTLLARALRHPESSLGNTLSRSQIQATLQRLGVDRWDEHEPAALWVAGAEDRRKWHQVAGALASLLRR